MFANLSVSVSQCCGETCSRDAHQVQRRIVQTTHDLHCRHTVANDYLRYLTSPFLEALRDEPRSTQMLLVIFALRLPSSAAPARLLPLLRGPSAEWGRDTINPVTTRSGIMGVPLLQLPLIFFKIIYDFYSYKIVYQRGYATPWLRTAPNSSVHACSLVPHSFEASAVGPSRYWRRVRGDAVVDALAFHICAYGVSQFCTLPMSLDSRDRARRLCLHGGSTRTVFFLCSDPNKGKEAKQDLSCSLRVLHGQAAQITGAQSSGRPRV